MNSEFKAIHPVKSLRDCLAQNIRPDGRGFLCFRPVSVNVNSITQADSSAVFKVGNTTVICGIKAELTAPKAETPDCGFIVPNVELPPLCSPKFRPGPPSEEAQCLTKLVDRILTNSDVLDLKNLCISKGKLVWILYCDLLCIDYDGSVIDACIGAMMAAFMVLKLPEVTYNPDTEGTIVHPTNRNKFPLRTITISTSVAVFDDDLLIVDPTEEEESLSVSRITIVMNQEDLCFVHKSGGAPVTQELLLKCLAASKKRSSALCDLLEKTVVSVKKDSNGSL